MTKPLDVQNEVPPIFKLITRQFMHNPYPTLSELRLSRAATPIETNGFRMWLVTRYADARKLLGNPILEKDLVAVKEKIEHCLVRPEKHSTLPRPVRRSMFEQDGDNHRRLRRLISHVFTSKRIAQMAPKVERVADDLLEKLPTGESIDLFRTYIRPLVTTVLSDLLGIPPESRDEFYDWANGTMTSTTPQAGGEAGRRMYAFCHEMADLKRREPRDDLFTELVEMERVGSMDFEEVIATMFLLLVGGTEPASAAANGVLTLLSHPDQLAKVLADPALWPDCVEEVLRYETSFRILPPRHCPVAVELDDITIPPNELIAVANSSANRDPAQFDRADVFDITRKSRNHLAFGHGPHKCLGAVLGRLEVNTVLRKLFARFPHTTLAVPPEELNWLPATLLRRVGSLPVVLR
ncbi:MULTISPECIES: cytochrome P450 [Rhizobium]|uniref:cytochrome P450 n=1 Tax=Rhizobium TaxID=379 RepID=UPI001C828B08|nr:MULTISPECIES: cytochrome P450 [Rhizobium]MBX4899700.1 cytochrome P450 [Rhizobium bangladeshense]MBX5297591.1 cytochrome P450 [Rhizobium sp. NLR15a]MBY3617873.1 cytochrome P450 [Rhizobium bangladeshense]